MTHKALSVRQPWAWLIAHGYKPFENRKWKTKHRGPLLIQASLRIDYAGYNWVREQFPHIPLPPRSELQVGGIVGEVQVLGVVSQSTSPWFSGPHAMILEQGRPLPFTPCKGKLGIFTPKPDEVPHGY